LPSGSIQNARFVSVVTGRPCTSDVLVERTMSLPSAHDAREVTVTSGLPGSEDTLRLSDPSTAYTASTVAPLMRMTRRISFAVCVIVTSSPSSLAITTVAPTRVVLLDSTKIQLPEKSGRDCGVAWLKTKRARARVSSGMDC